MRPLALLNVRSAVGGSQQARLGRNLRRIAEVLAVATLVNGMWFPLFRQPKWLIRLDILHCVGLCLLLVLPALAGLARRPRVLAGLSLVLGLGVFAVSPLGESVRGPWAYVLNKSTEAVFPLLPWLGFAWLGAFAGTVAGAWGRAGLVKALSLLLFFRIFGFSFERFWGNRSGWAQYTVLTVALIALTYALGLAVDPAERALKKGLAGALEWLKRRSGAPDDARAAG